MTTPQYLLQKPSKILLQNNKQKSTLMVGLTPQHLRQYLPVIKGEKSLIWQRIITLISSNHYTMVLTLLSVAYLTDKDLPPHWKWPCLAFFLINLFNTLNIWLVLATKP